MCRLWMETPLGIYIGAYESTRALNGCQWDGRMQKEVTIACRISQPTVISISPRYEVRDAISSAL
jgi:hypothetical protein